MDKRSTTENQKATWNALQTTETNAYKANKNFTLFQSSYTPGPLWSSKFQQFLSIQSTQKTADTLQPQRTLPSLNDLSPTLESSKLTSDTNSEPTLPKRCLVWVNFLLLYYGVSIIWITPLPHRSLPKISLFPITDYKLKTPLKMTHSGRYVLPSTSTWSFKNLLSISAIVMVTILAFWFPDAQRLSNVNFQSHFPKYEIFLAIKITKPPFSLLLVTTFLQTSSEINQHQILRVCVCVSEGDVG